MTLRTARWLAALPLLLAGACVPDEPVVTGDTDPPETDDTDVPPVDADQDGYPADEDCDDTNPDIHPGAPEEDCTDPVDYDCDGETPLYADADADGWAACVDCDDDLAAVHPDADEVCDRIDNDCDGAIDDEDDDVVDARTWYLDADRDAYGRASDRQTACRAPFGYVDDDTDCNDNRRDIHPDANEVCDGEDNDCDRAVDDDDDDVVDQGTWYPDLDRDGLGDPDEGVEACIAPSGFIENGFDCDDGDPDGEEATIWYEDRDLDDWGDTARPKVACAQPSGHVAVDGDCDDLDDEVNPDAPEVCDEKDNDCDGDVDDDDIDVTGQTSWYVDIDGDGYGRASPVSVACFAPKGHVADDTDCDDTTHLVHPGRFDFDDDQDNDCDTAVDEDVGSETTTHESDVQAVWNGNCTRCHGSSGGLSLAASAYGRIVNAGSSVSGMDYIEPGDLRNSYLWHKLQGTHSSVGGRGSTMPYGGSLSRSDEAIVETWILEGAVE